ncbi:amino acid adenylation domain-containing protein [Pseudonocardia nantongensis]|uniref:amino acid adenylation domain-containing protein n=1 Tax=Pseudonocardia nantongensis TaxID=1181885 RepID=UPI00397DC0FC
MTGTATTPDLGARRAHWTRVLQTGGATATPRWAAGTGRGTGLHEAALPHGAVDSVAAALGVDPGAVLLAAHGAVLAALSGDTGVTAGLVVTADGPPLPVPLHTGGTWADLIHDAASALDGVRAYGAPDLPALAAELGLPLPEFGTVFDPDGAPGAPDDEVALRLGVADGRLLLRFRRDTLDPSATARIAGYHATALTLAAADPDAGVTASALVGAEERAFQLGELAGRPRVLPDRRVPDLLAERARSAPDEVVAERAGAVLTRAGLDARANRVARTLLEGGLQPEDVVAVVTERTLDWLVAVLAVLRAGGAYLPVEPHFPAGRISTTLTRAGCRWVLTEDGARENLDAADLPGTSVLTVADAVTRSTDESDPDVDIGPERLAYLYFTSGSTGEPKGAMCEHAGMLNHLLAKIEDLGLAEGCVVAQTAPQCFDISLWQLVAGPLVGGRTVLVEQEAILDVARLVGTLAERGVQVAQLVPSYLEVLLTYLEAHPTALPDLRIVSATGEALKRELVQRWFATMPHVPLVNAYGLTETSDDTNHAVLREVPDGDRVPLGRPVPGVRVYVVDADLAPVPLGAPGEIVFSGVCVGRGYVNDPDRTAAAFGADPHRPGERLYRSGDHGRWRPDGQLEFLGRRDTQVKIRGFRIEIGEIENALLRVPGIRDAAVVVADLPGGPQLVAFQAGDGPAAETVRAELAGSLPAYMVPSAVHRLDPLPVTPNGKIDRRALAVLAADAPAPAPAPVAGTGPRTPAEERVLGAVARVLDLPADAVSVEDHFGDLGGNSLSAVKLVIALDRAVTIKDVLEHPVLTDLAGLLPADLNGHIRGGES